MPGAAIVVFALALAAYLLFSPRLAKSSDWSATVTPLASIMGSGFLVSAPLLAGIVGNLALFCMAALLVLAYLVGGVVRFNIRYFEPVEADGHGPAQSLAFTSRLVLAGAYLISVSYYLQLLAAFVLSALGKNDQLIAHAITSTLLVTIGVIGAWRGLALLEKVEKYAIGLNLGIIGALIASLIVYNSGLLVTGEWALAPVSSVIDFADFRVLLGLLIVVQGFETSRYLGAGHSAEQRIRTMRRAQLISSAIYLTFIGLVTVLFHDGLGADVTAIIGMTRPVAVILPLLLAVAAIGSQFSAAVADNAGAGGLIEDITRHRLPIRYAYLLILVITLAITWETDVNQIIAYASRAFALYYFLQGVVAVVMAYKLRELPHRRARLAGYFAVSLTCLLVFVLGLPAE